MSEKRLNLKQLARAFGISQVSVRNWLDKGLPHERTHKGYTFNLSECVQWREKILKDSKATSSDYESARAEKELWRAKTVKLNYERLGGSLVSAAEVKKAAFQAARMTRDAILAVPDRVASLLAGEISTSGKIDKTRVHEILGKELRQALENLSNNLNQPEVENDDKN
ncbi:MAG: hypothetical protein DYG83_10300 [Candidatus Brocadia sp. AMX2]|uniref:Phage DNA packaging protein Nu1 n=1 Tax=Candidatus Brocadia sinica JPN1 TaxID=1197129 RepID=A0ABQ0JYJ5_9BACT|nr:MULTISPECIES: hypothetical protein [Brocadia]MBC6932885.1 hypothetical protein [Candidatus Brocadia sp.]MBL1167629.1 hypothetical protein [Candidatus Brocadia sp. AMX1]NOG40479.1 hypothetical protein [Planctomycetota bacterium]NUO06269.1 hypothetical protein [Candidatus Brocadia sinica]KAA0242090.1 MAG: hypothetical protein EDM70_15700 [Candidatus Brocadia sp. AMX2]